MAGRADTKDTSLLFPTIFPFFFRLWTTFQADEIHTSLKHQRDGLFNASHIRLFGSSREMIIKMNPADFSRKDGKRAQYI
jgi:hypothetical protein